MNMKPAILFAVLLILHTGAALAEASKTSVASGQERDRLKSQWRADVVAKRDAAAALKEPEQQKVTP